MDAKENIETIQQLADSFIKSSISLYEQRLTKRLEELEFTLKRYINDGKLVNFENKYFPVAYNFYKWESHKANFNWFVLQGSFKYTSNIVACLAFPKKKNIPVLSMNLNLKLDAKTFSVILGYKTPNQLPKNLFKAIQDSDLIKENPIYRDDNTEHFVGTRSSFEITSHIIEKTLCKAECYILSWLNYLESTQDNNVSAIDFTNKYKSELEKLHKANHTVYDELFGDSWLFNLFKNEIL
ncbi:hypothetical protein [Flavobacterium sp. KACC 22761]|uniref:hypothetical protein n=1 Tax=Flavobacterium sp. KACC 22761 TaxID=3092665 RepID=UPI002A758F96|nr:hypothetical protein [Flavobacterium sp. KACC 22761]WPO78871.1 hypothetical protein SCB73_00465 [Flavobacterium sp. KACC 22761]